MAVIEPESERETIRVRGIGGGFTVMNIPRRDGGGNLEAHRREHLVEQIAHGDLVVVDDDGNELTDHPLVDEVRAVPPRKITPPGTITSRRVIGPTPG